jgi:tripartite-type tricarboxylate transporter receptor subunit TctC
MNITRRASLLAPLALAAPSLARARAAWPAERGPVRVIVPLAAGGTADFLARTVAQKLQEGTGLAFAVENRTGGGGAIGWAATARAAADGTTIGVVDNALPIALAMNRDIGFDARTELEFITQMALFPPILCVSNSLPVSNLAEFIAYARARPGELFYGSGGLGSVPHLQAELLQEMTGIRLNHVPYRGMAQAVTDLIGGRLAFIAPVFPTAAGQLRAGAMRPIAVGAPERIAVLPDVPTAREQGVDFVSSASFGLAAPRGTAPATASRMREVVRTVAGEELGRRMAETGGRLVLNTGAEYRAAVEAETRIWGRIIRERNITPE